MVAVYSTGVKQHIPKFNLFPFKLDDIIEKNAPRKDGCKFAGWVIGVYLEQYVIYEINGLRKMIQIDWLENYYFYWEDLFQISDQRFEEIQGISFTDTYYPTYRNHNLE